MAVYRGFCRPGEMPKAVSDDAAADVTPAEAPAGADRRPYPPAIGSRLLSSGIRVVDQSADWPDAQGHVTVRGAVD